MSKRISVKKNNDVVKIEAPSDDSVRVCEELKPCNPQKMAVFGSRSIFDCRAKILINETLHEYETINTIVTSQEPRGVCEVSQSVAKENNMILELHFLNRSRYATGCFFNRSMSIINAADYVLLIHDGVSKGTQNELEYTQKSGKPYKYVSMQPSNIHVYRNEGENFLKLEGIRLESQNINQQTEEIMNMLKNITKKY